MLQLSQRPLTSSDADAALFAGRVEQKATIERAIALGFNSYVLGVPGSGKTSLLRQLARDIADLNPLFLSATEAAVLPAWLAGDPLVEGAVPARLIDHLDSQTPVVMRLLIVLDSDSADVISELFGRRRDELWELPLQWVVAGATELQPPADAFFEAVVPLLPFDSSTARDLIVRRVGTAHEDDEAETLRSLADELPELVGPIQPRQLLGAVRFVMLADDPQAAMDTLRSHSEAREDLSDTAGRVLSLLTVIGPTYSGDKRLLKELGMTRNRMVQVFGELEVAGLVTAERSGKRKIYRPAIVGA